MAKLYHVVMREATVTFTLATERHDFVHNTEPTAYVLCESYVHPDQFNKVTKWSKEGTDADV